MIRLKNIYDGKNALLISGGPSALGLLSELKNVDREKYVIFLESKALTPYYLEHGIEPDYYLLPYPEKAKDNSLQNLAYQSLKVNAPIKPFVKKEFHGVIEEVLNNKKEYFVPWNPARGPHKRIKYKDNLHLKDSPLELLKNYSKTKIITIKESFLREFPDVQVPNQFYYFEFNDELMESSYDNYINLLEKDGKSFINRNSYSNSAAISTFPILNYLGFSEIYFLGFDMNLLGTFEYNGLNTFKSIFHYQLFLILIRHAIRHGAAITINFPPYLRPKQEFRDLEKFIDQSHFKMYRVIGDQRKVGKVKNLNWVDIEKLFKTA